MKDLKAVKGRYLIQRLIAQGEHEQQDFKFAISDARKIARSVSAFANNKGGCLLIGVKDNGAIAGVRNEEDIYVVEQAAQMYCDPPQSITFEAFKVDANVIVIRATVAKAYCRPVRVREENGKLRAYFRIADENIAAHPLMVQAWTLRDRACETESAFLLDGLATDILDVVRNAPEPIDPGRLPLLIHRGIAETKRVAAKLLSLGLIDMEYINHGFRLTVATTS